MRYKTVLQADGFPLNAAWETLPIPPLLRGTLLIAKCWEYFFVLEIQPAPRRQMCGAGRPRLSPCCHLPAARSHRSGVVPTRVAPQQCLRRQQGVDKAAPPSFPSTLRRAPWYLQSCIPVSTPPPSQGTSATSVRGTMGRKMNLRTTVNPPGIAVSPQVTLPL